MSLKQPGVHLLNALATVTEADAYQPQLAITEKELIAKVAVDDEAFGIYEADFSYAFRKRPELTRALAFAFTGIANGNKKSSAMRTEKYLKGFLEGFLDGMERSHGEIVSTPYEVDRKLIDKFHEWLSGERKLATSPSARGEDLVEISAKPYYNTLKRAFRELATSEEFEVRLNPNLSFLDNPFPGSHHAIEHRKPLSEQAIRLIRKACQDEIRRAIDKLDNGRRIKSQPCPLLRFDLGPTAFMTLERSVHGYIYADENGYWDEPGTLALRMPGFKRATQGRYFYRQDIREHLHFTSATIMPFVVLLYMDFLFDVDGHIGIRWSSIETSPFTDQRIRISSVKNRGGGVQVKTVRKRDTYYFSVPNLLEMLKTHTEYTRRFVSADYRDNVFIFVDRDGRAKGFQSQTVSGTFGKSLEAFISRNGLEHFTLSQLRPTARVLVGSGIGVAKELLHHNKIETTETSYDPPEGQQATREDIAYELAIRERNLSTGYKIDTRGKALSRHEKTAATPGFYCFDPLRSPVAGQTEGKLCSAYGSCPNCPLANVDLSSSKAAYRLHQLLDRFRDLQLKCNEHRWAEHWHPQMLALNSLWIPKFTKSAVKDALNLRLSPIPELE